MKQDLTKGNVTKALLVFAVPMMLGNLMQQLYNIADTWVVGKFVGADALASVGSAYTLMTFLTSILIGLCMGGGAVFSYYMGKQDRKKVQSCAWTAFVLIGGAALLLTALVQLFMEPVLRLLRTPPQLTSMMRDYLFIVFWGIFFVFLYNYFAFLLRSLGNSVVPLWFLGGACGINVVLDLVFVLNFGWGLKGAAFATVLAQSFAGVGLGVYTWIKEPWLRFQIKTYLREKKPIKEVLRLSAAASLQQSVMNFGILMIQGLVNSFGVSVMAAFAAAVKIDTFAYMPAQEFGNAYSMFVSQNFGAQKRERIRKGSRSAFGVCGLFCAAVSVLIFAFAAPLMEIFVDSSETQIIEIGQQYLRIEGAFYVGIGILFLFYGYFRGINRPEISLFLTIISLGTRVALAYALASVPAIGVYGIWWSIPIGWGLADLAGWIWMKKYRT